MNEIHSLILLSAEKESRVIFHAKECDIVNDLIAVKVESAKRLLAEARDTESAKRVVDLAHAAEIYARRQRLSEEAIANAHAVKVDAMTLLGDFLKAAPKNGGAKGNPGGRGAKIVRSHDGTAQPKLADHGVSKKESSDSQFLADVRAKAPEVHDEIRAGTIRLDQARKQMKKQSAAMEAVAEDACVTDDLERLIKTKKRFGTIYADPPWAYSNQATRAATDTVYPTMSVAEIAALPIGDLAADDAHLHLWTTNAFLFETQRLFESWGFEYKSAFIWCKPQMGIGNYWRVSHEFLLLGVRGRCPFADRGLKSWASIDRGEHSVKPQAVRRMIEAASPGPRLELFARRPANGWVVWGNGITRDMFDADLEAV